MNTRVTSLIVLTTAMTIATLGCQDSSRLLSVAEAMTVIPPAPLYAITIPFEGKQIDTVYRHFRDSSEGTNDTYFTITDLGGEVTRVARLRICSACDPFGPGEEIDYSTYVSLPAPLGTRAHTCNIVQEAYRGEVPNGQEYKTCLFWIDESGYRYKLYSIWDLAETLAFLENIERVN